MQYNREWPCCPVNFYRRNLPHWHPEGVSFFLTWRLHGSLPVSFSTARNGCATKDSPGTRFKLPDTALDKSTTAPFWLKSPRIAKCVVNLIHKGDSTLGYFTLHAFVVMPHHIHMLITPKLPIPRIMNGLKGATARAAKSLLRRKGKRFWQDESFDHWVHSSKEFDRNS